MPRDDLQITILINLILVKLHDWLRSDAPQSVCHPVFQESVTGVQSERALQPSGWPSGTQDGQGQGRLPLFTPFSMNAAIRQMLEGWKELLLQCIVHLCSCGFLCLEYLHWNYVQKPSKFHSSATSSMAYFSLSCLFKASRIPDMLW